MIESVVNGGAFVDSLDDLDAWARKGVRIFGFVHAGHNRLADSSRRPLVRGEGPSRSGGLSPLGKAAVARLNQLGVLIDVCASFRRGLCRRAVTEQSARDRNPFGPARHRRQQPQPDRRSARRAEKNGGVIGINAFSAYLRPRDPAFAAKLKALEAEYGLTGRKWRQPAGGQGQGL